MGEYYIGEKDSRAGGGLKGRKEESRRSKARVELAIVMTGRDCVVKLRRRLRCRKDADQGGPMHAAKRISRWQE